MTPAGSAGEDAAVERAETAARQLLLQRLADGRPVRLRVLTGSMSPLLRPGEELLVAPAPRRLRPGRLVVFLEDERLVCHRLLLPAGRDRWLQKGDLNFDWRRVRRERIVGAPVAVLAGGRRCALEGPRFLVLDALVFLLVIARDLGRLAGRVLPPAGRLSERLLSRALGAIIGRIRSQGGRDVRDPA